MIKIIIIRCVCLTFVSSTAPRKIYSILLFSTNTKNYDIVSTFLYLKNAEHSCTTPDNQTGDCIAIQRCPPLSSLILPTLSIEKRDFLRRSQCGFDGNTPLVQSFNYYFI